MAVAKSDPTPVAALWLRFATGDATGVSAPLCFTPLSRLGSVLRHRSNGEGKEIRNCSHVTSLLFSPEPVELQALPSDSSDFLLSHQPWRFLCFPRPQIFMERAPSCAVPASVLACTEG